MKVDIIDINLTCKKCGNIYFSTRPNPKKPDATDIICDYCGAWQKFANKDEIRLLNQNKENMYVSYEAGYSQGYNDGKRDGIIELREFIIKAIEEKYPNLNNKNLFSNT